MNIKEYMSHFFWRERTTSCSSWLKQETAAPKAGWQERDGNCVLAAQNQTCQEAQRGKAIALPATKTQLHVEIRIASCHKVNALHFLPQSLLEGSWSRQPEHPLPSTVRMLHHISSVTLYPCYFLFQQ